jgi:hypothetical protein
MRATSSPGGSECSSREAHLQEHVVGVDPRRELVDTADDEPEGLLVNEPFADRALEDPRVRQPGEGVAIGEEPQLGEQGSISFREVARDDPDGHEGDEPDAGAGGEYLAR